MCIYLHVLICRSLPERIMMRPNHGVVSTCTTSLLSGYFLYGGVFSIYTFSERHVDLFPVFHAFPMVLQYMQREPKNGFSECITKGRKWARPGAGPHHQISSIVYAARGNSLQFASPMMASSFSFSLLARASKSRFSILTPVKSSEHPVQTRIPQLLQTRRDSLPPS